MKNVFLKKLPRRWPSGNINITLFTFLLFFGGGSAVVVNKTPVPQAIIALALSLHHRLHGCIMERSVQGHS